MFLSCVLMRVNRPCRADGFTLIEVMVALSIFSIAILALLKVGSENAKAMAAVEARFMANIVAENKLVEAVFIAPNLEMGFDDGTSDLARRHWVWERTVTPTAEQKFSKVEIAIKGDESGFVITKLSGFRGQR